MQNGDTINGNDLLVRFDDEATGHSTSHTTTFNTETKDVAVKPLASAAQSSAGLYKKKRVTGLSVQIKCEGLAVYGETESGLQAFLAKWKVGASVECEGFSRPATASQTAPAPYLSGNFIITSLENTAPAGEDATYSITLDNDGPVTIDETKIAAGTTPSGGSGEQS